MKETQENQIDERVDERLYKLLTKDSGFYVEVGAGDGITDSPTLLLENYGWQGILIESNIERCAHCKINRPKAAVLNYECVASDYSDDRVEEEKGGQENKLRDTKSNARTLTAILEEFEVKNFDLLVLNVNDHGLNVFKELDLFNHRPDYILMEDGAETEIISSLADYHYKLLKTRPNNHGTPKALYQTAEKQLSDTSEDVIADNAKWEKLERAWDIVTPTELVEKADALKESVYSEQREVFLLQSIGLDRDYTPAYLRYAELLLERKELESSLLNLKEAERLAPLLDKYQKMMQKLEAEADLDSPKFKQYLKRAGQVPVEEAEVPKRILVVTNLLPPQEMGGFGKTVWEFCQMLNSRGHNLRILTADMPHLYRESDNDIQEVEKYVARDLHLFGDWKNGRTVIDQGNETIRQKIAHNHQRILAEVERFQPEACLVGNLDFMGYDFLTYLLQNGIPVVHRLGNETPSYPVQATPNSSLYCLAGCSKWLNRKLQDKGYSFPNTDVLYPGSALETCYRYYPPSFDYLRICFAGLMMPYKGAQVLVEALVLLHQWRIPFICELAGDTTDPLFVQTLQNKAQEAGFADRLFFSGFLGRQKLAALYARSNVMVFPSVFEEPFGKSQIEAMASGLVVISSGTGGSTEIVTHGNNGLIFENNNPQDLAQKLLYLSQNRERARELAAQGHENAFNFTTTRSIKKLETLIAQLESQKPSKHSQSFFAQDLSHLSTQTIRSIQRDKLLIEARGNYSSANTVPSNDKLHIGCGTRKIQGWLNVDVINSDYDLDLAWDHPLPWPRESFSTIVAQHFIEHLDIESELPALLKRLFIVAKKGCQIWLSCPDIEKICASYLKDKCMSLLEGRKKRFPNYTLRGFPTQQLINELFHQQGEHQNLFDFELLEWLLIQAGFVNCRKSDESDFLYANPDFPCRNDDDVSLYVCAVKESIEALNNRYSKFYHKPMKDDEQTSGEVQDDIKRLVKNNPGQMSYEEYAKISNILNKKGTCNFLVFGVGFDSMHWMKINKNGKIVFLEDNESWLKKIKENVPNIEAHLIKYVTKRRDSEALLSQYKKGYNYLNINLPDLVYEVDWDVILVDGPGGYGSDTPGRMQSIYMAFKLAISKSKNVDLFIHDCDREVEREYSDYFCGNENLVNQVHKLRHYFIPTVMTLPSGQGQAHK